jgi:hypothetical protein
VLGFSGYCTVAAQKLFFCLQQLYPVGALMLPSFHTQLLMDHFFTSLRKSTAFMAKENYGWNPLHHATQTTRIDNVMILIKGGAKISAQGTGTKILLA